MPSLNKADEVLLEDLLLRWEELREQGREADVGTLCAGRPDLLAELEQRIRDLNEVDVLLNRPGRPAGPRPGQTGPGGSLAAAGRGPTGREGPPRERLGRFRLLKVLGRGAMGEVYRAEDTADGSVVAIKVLRPDRLGHPEALRRLLKEARLMAQVKNPYVVRLLDVGQDAELHYLVMEFVAGRSLGRRLTECGRMDETSALAIIADVARALVEPHALGIVHRDIKPDNILFVELVPPTTRPMSGNLELSPLQLIKLSDFGLARHVVESDSQAMTRHGAILGTPCYMAPEQGRGEPIDARADVYSMGATLYHMLAGRPPFVASDWAAILEMHRHAIPPPLVGFNPAVSGGVCQVIEKALAKSPEARYPDAAAMLRDVERLLHGEPTGIDAHPRLPECNLGDVLQFALRWELEASPQQLWPFVSNTERWNRAVGLPAPHYATRADPDRGVRRFAETDSWAWEEHPYEWVEGRSMGVLREYSRGPFKWALNEVELAPRAGGGTLLSHRIRVEPRGPLVRKFAQSRIRRWVERDFGRVYRRIDAAVSGRLGGATWVDPFEEPAALPKSRLRLLDNLLDALCRRGVDPIVVERLGDFLAHAPAPEVARIRPLHLARRLGLDPDQVVAASLQGAREGLLVLLWDLVCPVCRISSGFEATLRALRTHGHCEACGLDYQHDFAHSVELVFRAHPQIRDVDAGTYCIGGPAHSPHVAVQMRVAPGERIVRELDLAEGDYRLRGPQLPWSVDFRVRPFASARHLALDLASGPDPTAPKTLRAGVQVLILSNGHERELVARVERTAPRGDALTAARAATLALFRYLFPTEVLAPSQLVSIANVTLLLTDLDQADDLYRDLDDARAFGVLHEYFRVLDNSIRTTGGTLVKTVDEGVLAVFDDAATAVRVGLGLQALLDRHEPTRGLRLRVGLHRGAAMVATLNDRLDYFGAAVRQARQLLQTARGGEVVLSQAVAADPRVADLLVSLHVEAEVIPTGPTDAVLDPPLRVVPPGWILSGLSP
jgi:serine/threonine protein kinase/class 3 adenylate cyclase